MKKNTEYALQCPTLFDYAALLQSTGWLSLREEFHLLFTMQRLQSTGLLKLREEFPLISRAEQGVLDPGDCYLTETSARPTWTTYDTVHAKPYVSRDRRGRPNELST